MKKKLKLSVNTPCQEKFDDFTPTQKGGFCDSCAKEVIDFTSMTDQEIVDYFEQHSGKACGRFHPWQLKSYPLNNNITASTNYAALGVVGLSLASLLAANPAQAQEQKPPVIEVWQKNKKDSVKPLSPNRIKNDTITGVVSDQHGPLPGVSVLLKGTVIGTDTDFDGKFTFPKPLKADDVLVFSYLGYQTVEVKVDWFTTIPLKMKMTEDMTACNLIVVGEVQVDKLFKSKKSFFKKRKKKN